MSSKHHDIRLAKVMAELAKQMVDPLDKTPGSPDICIAVQNMFSALATMIYRYERVDPSIVLGGMEIAKANILHDLHECITLQRLKDGE